MLHFNHKDYSKWSRATKAQYQYNAELQAASENDFLKIAQNAGLTPGEAYREMEDRTEVILNPVGEFATLQRLNAVGRAVNLGRTVYTYRKASGQTGGQTSMSGQVGIIKDNVDYKYGNTVIPIHDHATKRDWREALTMGADGFDYMVDDQREGELVTLRRANDYFWNGDTAVKGPNGEVWEGVKGGAADVATDTLGLSLIGAGGETASEITTEVNRLKDVLRISNNCPGLVDIAVSRETMSYWRLTPYSANDKTFGTIYDYVVGLNGVASVYEEPALSGGGDIFMAYINLDGLHAVTGQAMSSYMKERAMHNDPFIMVKWMAQGFVSKSSFSGQKSSLYAATAQ